MFFDQARWAVRCEWGEQGVRELAPFADALVIVAVLSFTTCVEVALSCGASVLPYRWHDDSMLAFAQQHAAIAASRERRFADGFSLSLTSLLSLPAGTKLVLPSPNGATLCALAEEILPGRVFADGLRNAAAVGAFVSQAFERVLVVPAGERWPDGSLRPAVEDWLGAGAVISAMQSSLAPEAALARQAFHHAETHLVEVIQECSSGRELAQRGFMADVALACDLNSSLTVPHLSSGIFQAATENPGRSR